MAGLRFGLQFVTIRMFVIASDCLFGADGAIYDKAPSIVLFPRELFAMMSSIAAPETAGTISDAELARKLFQLMRQEEMLAAVTTTRQFLPWDCIASAEEVTENLYIVAHGLVQILITSKEGRRLVTSVLRPGMIFGEDVIFQAQATSPTYCAQAIKPSIVWQIPGERADEILNTYPVMRLAALRSMGQRVAQVENRLEEVAYRLLPERLAAELIRQSRYFESYEIRLSHQALADMLGTYRETISAILRDFREADWVKLGYRRITILRPNALESMAGPVRS